MRKKRNLTIDEWREFISYDPRTGNLHWLVNRQGGVKRGDRAGTPNKGYIQIQLFGLIIHAHRVAWALAFGEWPEGHIDHINGCKSDNRLSNLRLATRSENLCNRGVQRNKRSCQLKGVFPANRGAYGTWFASITVDGNVVYLGTFPTPELAHAAYCDAALKFHGEFARVA